LSLESGGDFMEMLHVILGVADFELTIINLIKTVLDRSMGCFGSLCQRSFTTKSNLSPKTMYWKR
jgi:hypothetical protein